MEVAAGASDMVYNTYLLYNNIAISKIDTPSKSCYVKINQACDVPLYPSLP